MVAKKITILIIALAFVFTVAGIVQSASNSAPNFECMTCHQSGIDAGMIKIIGIPKIYVPGKTYKLTLSITSDIKSISESQGGFAIKASAGEIKASDKKNTQIAEGIFTHTIEGSRLRKWSFEWKAPKGKEDVSIDVMAVAANGDFSPFGDKVSAYSYEIKGKK